MIEQRITEIREMLEGPDFDLMDMTDALVELLSELIALRKKEKRLLGIEEAAKKIGLEGEYSEYPEDDWEDVSVHLDGKAWIKFKDVLSEQAGGEMIEGNRMNWYKKERQLLDHIQALRAKKDKLEAAVKLAVEVDACEEEKWMSEYKSCEDAGREGDKRCGYCIIDAALSEIEGEK